MVQKCDSGLKWVNNFIKKGIAGKWSTKSKRGDLFIFRNEDIYFNSESLRKFLFYLTAKNIHGDFYPTTLSKLGE